MTFHPRSDLVDAYEATHYEVFGKHQIVLLVATPAGTYDEWLATNGAQSAAIITGWNPFGEMVSDELNEAANRELQTVIENVPLRWVPACGIDPEGRWSEDSFCVFDASDTQIDEWLSAFDQNAALAVALGERAHLVWHPRYRET